MMKMTLRSAALIIALCISTGIASAQVATGIPPFGSFGGGPFDTVNLANANVHFSIPIVTKAGRGLPFTYSLGYDTSVWYPATVNGTTSWQPLQNWGWIAETEGATGTLDASFTSGCVQYYGCWYAYYNYVYVDAFGAPHPIDFWYTGIYGCNGADYGGTAPPSCPASDGSGWALVANYNVYPGYNYMLNAQGRSLIPPANSNTGTAGETDSNGNQISVSSSGVFTDTLGTTALTIAGSNPMTLQYTAPSGSNVQYQVKYTSYTVKTAFNCSGIAEYSGTQNLVSEIDLPDQGQVPSDKYTFTYETTPGYSPGSGVVTGRLISITLPTGATINYSYSGGSNGITCADGSTATLTRSTPDGQWQYAHTESGTAWETVITPPAYNGQTDQTTMYFQGIYPTESQTTQNGSTLKTVYTCYNGAAKPCNSTAITLPITQRTTYVDLPGSAGTAEAETNTYYDTETCPGGGGTCSNGLVTQNYEYDYASTGQGALLRRTAINYQGFTSTFPSTIGTSQLSFSRPSQVSVYNGSGTLVAQTNYGYDQYGVASSGIGTQHVSISGSRGNQTTVTRMVSGSSSLTKTSTYFDTGMIDVATDVNGAQTTYSYGACNGAFPTSIAGPLLPARAIAWNCTGGVPTSTTDENSQTISYTWNDADFWRVGAVTDPLGNVTNYYYQPNSTYSTPPEVATSMTFGNSVVSDIRYEDGLWRTYTDQRLEAPGSSTLDTTSYAFDSYGRKASVSGPCATGYTGTCSTPSTTTTYDALGRPTQVSDSGGGTISYQYTGNDVLETIGPAPSGENTKRKQLEYDALGRLTSVCEITSMSGSGSCGQTNAATGYLTTYTYDVLGDLTGVNQSGQTRSYSYDGLGRMTSEINPESGVTTYSYDAPTATCTNSYWNPWMPGTLVQKQDAIGNITCYVHDLLGRIGSIWVGAGPGQWGYSGCKDFLYDNSTGLLGAYPSGVSPANTMGRLAEAVTWDCTWPPTQASIHTDEWFSYDARGETTDLWQWTPHSGGYYHSNATYWANGLLYQLTSSIGYSTNYIPDGEGRINSAASGTELASTLYNPAGLPTQVNFASGDSDSFTYDPNTNRMTQYKFNVNGQSLAGNLTWNANGTLASLLITDPFNSANTQSCTYAHDDLARLAGVNCSGSGWSQTFSYDAYGNLTTSGSGPFQPGYNSNNQMQAPATYDANGNATNDDEHTYAWDAYGRPTTIDGVSVTYDALGRTVEQSSGGVYTEVQYSPTGFRMYLLNGTSMVKAWVPMPAGTAEVFTPGAFYYQHSDWLGSSRFASTTGRAMYYDAAYAPFGQPYVESGTTDRDFTGMDQDIVSGLYDFPAREYNGNEGRWSSPDPAGLDSVDLTDPQTWNRYAYVRNSPLMMTDPTGMEGEPAGCDIPDECVADPYCGFMGCWNPLDFAPDFPTVYGITNFTPPPTTGLPSGIFSNGPGVDYSWLGLLQWAGLIHPCEDIGCFQNWHTGPTGLVIGDYIGEHLCNSDGGACQDAWWNGKFWGSQCDLDPDWCADATIFGQAGEIASPKNILTVYGASVAVGIAAPFVEPAYLFFRTNPWAAIQCTAGAISATQGPVPPGTTGLPGAVCGGAVKGARWIYNNAIGGTE